MICHKKSVSSPSQPSCFYQIYQVDLKQELNLPTPAEHKTHNKEKENKEQWCKHDLYHLCSITLFQKVSLV